MDKEKISGFISRLRKEKGMTQKELATTLNVTDKAVSKWERGQGYPDISIISSLAEALGVSVGELLNGERASSPEETPADPESLIQNTLEYAKTVEKQRRVNGKSMAALTITFSCLIAVFVCVLCNFTISGTISWSLYVVDASVLAWVVSMPLIYGKKYRFLLALACLTVLALPFLLLLEGLTPAKGWVGPVAVPAALVVLGYLWLICLLQTFTRIRLWFLCAIAAFLVPAVNIPVNLWISRYLNEPYDSMNTIIPILCSVVVGVILLAVGIFSRKKEGAE